MILPVAPLVGARIEIIGILQDWSSFWVAPLVGARIEIFACWLLRFPSLVAPLVGARIEITGNMRDLNDIMSRSPRGSAD